VTKAILFSTLILLAASSCKNEMETVVPIDYSGFSEKEVVLVGVTRQSDDPDTIGKVFIKIPHRLDTFYRWINRSDCRFCNTFQYRFADSRYKQFAESGWFWTYIPDSTYQFTITHTPFWDGPDSISLKQLTIQDSLSYERLAYQLAVSDKPRYIKKEFKEINGRAFLIVAFTSSFGFLTNDTTLYLTAKTQLKKRELTFIAECGAKDTAGFLDNMFKVIMSIKIEEK
jgi:hypothetical protein